MSFTSSVPLIFIPLIDIKALAYNDHDIIDILALQSRSSFNKLALVQREAATYCDPFDLAGKDASKSLKMGKMPFSIGLYLSANTNAADAHLFCNCIQAPIV